MITSGRTDLASEACLQANASLAEGEKLNGVTVNELSVQGFMVNAVEILNEQGVQALRKPKGKYYTLHLPAHFSRGSDDFSASVTAVSQIISWLIPKASTSYLIAALGNPDITPDALGNLTAASILITRHFKQKDAEEFSKLSSVAAVRPGVLGTSGIESAVQVASLCRETGVSLVLAVDALAGSDAEGLCRSIQITDSGLAPGSGVGNNRDEISSRSLGIPVIAVGMPTVIDASSFSKDELKSMFVTPRDIDFLVRQAARVIGYGINLALHPGLSIQDVDMLIG